MPLPGAFGWQLFSRHIFEIFVLKPKLAVHTMLLADKKKKENISEYIIYMYQTEDLIRAYQFNIEEIKQQVISQIENADQEALYEWYLEIARQMQAEGLEKRGHLNAVQEIVTALNGLHESLLKADQQYRQLYSKTALHIHKSMEQSKGAVKEPVQAALNGIYGYLLLRLHDQKVDESLMPAINSFGDMLSYLSYRWHEH